MRESRRRKKKEHGKGMEGLEEGQEQGKKE